MKVTMDMCNFEIEHDTIEADYGDEILYAGWNPEVDSVSQQLLLVPTTEQTTMPTDLATEVVELFLRKMYSCQR
jgi:alanine racemase